MFKSITKLGQAFADFFFNSFQWESSLLGITHNFACSDRAPSEMNASACLDLGMMSNASITEHVSARTSTQNKGCTKVGFSWPAFKCDYQATLPLQTLLRVIDLHRRTNVSPMFAPITHQVFIHLTYCWPSHEDSQLTIVDSLFK